MKLKIWHLFIVITILFVCSFYVVNLRFDKFYRVNGINNDNRVLLEQYLDEDEQSYLVENQISIDLFIDYLKEDQFILQNYQYYNALKDSGRYYQTKDILDIGNSLSTRLTYLYNDNAFQYGETLIQESLEMAFLNKENFQFENMNMYIALKDLYEEQDYSFVDDTEFYIQRLDDLGITSKKDKEEKMSLLCKVYSKEQLLSLMRKPLSQHTEIVFNPNEYTTIVDQNHYIGEYEPHDLILLQDVPRARYTMYLRRDAYFALAIMYEDLSQQYDGFVVLQSYTGKQFLNEEDIGYQEMQLGLTICVTDTNKDYKNFVDSEISQWLEKHAYEYGFVLRYPKNKASDTGYSYDSHYYRYVGKTAARTIYEQSLSLEEYSTIPKDESD